MEQDDVRGGQRDERLEAEAELILPALVDLDRPLTPNLVDPVGHEPALNGQIPGSRQRSILLGGQRPPEELFRPPIRRPSSGEDVPVVQQDEADDQPER